ncbi:hypothetical protein [Geodermatophilus sp. URMC 62]|uniref:hypothetical protein n=1 Tax=Geodermatophilus sp. URMC 62 TaxID=3423414 RepID=UPI00406C945D
MTDSETWKDKYAQELFTYERLMARSIQTNSMQWQAPSLALAAQAFLLTIALRDQARPTATTTVCFVGVLMTLMAWQLMARHRYFFHLDQADMENLEDALDLLRISDRDRQMARLSRVQPPWLGRAWAYDVWKAGFFLIALVDVGIGLSAWWPAQWVIVGLVAALLAVWGWALLASAAHPLRIRFR